MDEPANSTTPPSHAIGMPPTPSSIGFGQVAISTVIVVTIIGVFWLAIELNRFFMLVFAAIVLGAVFQAIAGWIGRITRISRTFSLVLAVIGLFAVFIGSFVLFGTQLANEFDTIEQTVPGALQRIQGFLDNYGLGDQARDLAKVGAEDISRLLTQAGGYALAASSGLADLVLVIVGAIFMAGNPDVYRRGLLLMLPAKAEPVMAEALDNAGAGLRGWMMGQAISSLVIGALTWGGLSLLGVPASGGLAIIAGLLDIIPMVGPVLSGIPAVLLAFTVSPVAALWTLVLFLVIQQLQGNVLQPMIQRHAVDVPPALLLFAVLAAGLLFGFLGVLLASPLTIVCYVFVQRIYVQAILGKAIKVAGAD